jgi:hypothetical protein
MAKAVWQEARRYFDLAGRLISPRPPLLVAIGGLWGTKSLARGLAGLIEPPPGALIVARCRSQTPFRRWRNHGVAASRVSGRYHGTGCKGFQCRAARSRQGCSVVLDAAYLQESERKDITGLAGGRNTPFVGLFLTADLATRLARIEQRQGDASDATRDVAMKQETFAIGAVEWHAIDASGTAADTLRRASAFLPVRVLGDDG